MAERTRRQPTYAFTLLVGLTCAALMAFAATREWARASGVPGGIRADAATPGTEAAPLVAALALVALAAWGVVLVTRGRVRRAVAVLGAVAAAGALTGVLVAHGEAQDSALEALLGQGGPADAAVASLTAWYYLTGVSALATALAFTVAVWRSPSWPSMSSRYDAPAARAQTPVTEEDMWRALDRGRDPTS